MAIFVVMNVTWDGSIEFCRNGVNIYDITAEELKGKTIAEWTNHLSRKNWFSEQLGYSFIAELEAREYENDQDLAALEITIRDQHKIIVSLEKENEDIKTAISDIMARYQI